MLAWEVLLPGSEVFGACLEGAQLGGAWCLVGRYLVLFWICLMLSQDVLGSQLGGTCAWLGGAWYLFEKCLVLSWEQSSCSQPHWHCL